MSGDRDIVRAWGPASLSNLGPGFDTLGLCLSGLGDVVQARRVDMPGVLVEGSSSGTPTDPASNTAARAAAAVLAVRDPEAGVALTVRKGILPGSGLGSSAASAVAGALAAAALFESRPDREPLLDAALEGEAAVSTARHGDNVLPSMMGGLVLVSPSNPLVWRRVPLGGSPAIAIVRPALTVLTSEARAMLPATVPLRDAVRTAASLAFLVDAFRAGDWETVGRSIEQDLLVEPVRARLVPPFEAVRSAAREAGAFGCALSGSGPAMFAVCPNEAVAEVARRAMHEACGAGEHRSVVSSVDPVGAHVTSRNEPPLVL